MGIALAEFVERINQEFPPDTAIDGDVTGLQIQAGRREISAVLVCLDVTDDTVMEAEAEGYDAIVSFHPLLFHPLRALTEEERVGRLCTWLIQRRIALFALHTRVDTHPDGTNARFARAMGLRVREPLIRNPRYPGYGMGVIAEADSPIAAEELLRQVLQLVRKPVRYVPGASSQLRTIAIVGGSGASFVEAAIACGVDAFVTGDIKYHTFHQAYRRIWLVDAGHAETERFAPDALAEGLRQCLPPDIRIGISRKWCTPIRWYGSSEDGSSIVHPPSHEAPDRLSGSDRGH